MPGNTRKTRLIVSFIGETDMKYLPPVGDDYSPILRVLMALNQFEPYIQPNNTHLLLFDEIRPGRDAKRQNERQAFHDKLLKFLPELGLDAIELEPLHPISFPRGPTDLNVLYEAVWSAIPRSGPGCPDEVLFNFSSGTPAMKFTMLLAHQCLPLKSSRLIESSRQQGVLEVRLPYVLAAREIRGRNSVRRASLNKQARNTLLPNTVIDDLQVKASYTALYKAATNTKQPQRLLLKGPVGSGKWHACRQFAIWRKAAETIEWPQPGDAQQLPDSATLLIRHLDTWSSNALHDLTELAANRPDLAIAATFRTDLPPIIPLQEQACLGLRGAAHIDLPALGARSDIVTLGEALGRQLGILGGKLKQRFQCDWLTDIYPRNIHDLKSLLATTAIHSPGAHPERVAYLRAREVENARAYLGEAWQILSGIDFGPGRHELDNVLDVIRATVVRITRSEGRSQEEAGKLLGCTQQTISEIERQELDLSLWQTKESDGQL